MASSEEVIAQQTDAQPRDLPPDNGPPLPRRSITALRVSGEHLAAPAENDERLPVVPFVDPPVEPAVAPLVEPPPLPTPPPAGAVHRKRGHRTHPPPPPSDDDHSPSPPRDRGCAASFGEFFSRLFSPAAAAPAPPRPRVLVVKGVRVGPDGKPLRLQRKARAALALQEGQAAVRQQLVDLHIDVDTGLLSSFSSARLKQFLEALDAPKKHIFNKAPEVAATLGVDLLAELSKPTLVSVALPWGRKKGHAVSASLRLKVVDPPYDPGARGPRPGALRLLVDAEAGRRGVTIVGVNANTSPDNVVGVLTSDAGQVLINTRDEPARWKWLLAINTGLHRVSATKVLMDQAAAMMPWHPACRVRRSPRNESQNNSSRSFGQVTEEDPE